MLQVCAQDGPPLPLVSCLSAHRPRESRCPRPRGLILSLPPPPQGEQLRGLLQLQVLHPLPGLLAGVLPVHCRHRAAVLHQILDSECSRGVGPPLRAADAEPGSGLKPGSAFGLLVRGAAPRYPTATATATALNPPTSLLPLSAIPAGSLTLGLCSLSSPSAIGTHRSRHSCDPNRPTMLLSSCSECS